MSTMKEDSAFGPKKPRSRKVDLSAIPSWMPGGKPDKKEEDEKDGGKDSNKVQMLKREKKLLQERLDILKK